MQKQNRLIVFVSLIVCLLWSSTSRADVTDTVQELLPATVAIELKTKQPDPSSNQKSQTRIARQTLEQLALQQTEAAEQQSNAAKQQLNAAKQQLKAAEQQLQATLQATLSHQLKDQPVQTVDAVSYATGTIVSADGLIVTTLGSDEGKFKITLQSGKELPANLVAVDRRSGLQLLKTNADELSFVELSAGEVPLGEQVATVVCTDLNDRAAATGIITAKDRTVDDLAVELLQTDVQIGPMTAGAPLANLQGEVIGIFVAKEDDATQASFAIPVKYVRELLDSQSGQETVVLERAFLGVRLNDEHEAVENPYVIQIVKDSAAEKAGMKVGDVIVKIDEETTATPKEVVRLIGRHKAGDTVTITSQRDGKPAVAEVILGTHPKRDSDADVSKHTIQLWHPGRVVTAGEHGNVEIWLDHVGGAGKLLLADRLQKAKPPLTDDQYKALIESYNRALQAQSQIGSILGQPTIRVERSNLEKQLGQLTERVKSLQAEVEKLNKALEDMGQKLSEE